MMVFGFRCSASQTSSIGTGGRFQVKGSPAGALWISPKTAFQRAEVMMVGGGLRKDDVTVQNYSRLHLRSHHYFENTIICGETIAEFFADAYYSTLLPWRRQVSK